MKILSTILGLVVEGEDDSIVVYNYSQHQRYTLTREQLRGVNIGEFPFLLFAVPRYAEHDVIGYDGHICFVQNRKLFDITTKERCMVKQLSVSAKGPFGARPFRKFCFVIKNCASYEDALSGKIDPRLYPALEISDMYPSPNMVAQHLNRMLEDPQYLSFYNHEWTKACRCVMPYWEEKGELPVLSLDVLKR